MSHYLVQRIENSSGIELMPHMEVHKMLGDESLDAVEIINNQTQATQAVDIAAVFIFIGAVPRTNWLPVEIERDEKGFIKTGLEVAQSEHWQANRQPFFHDAMLLVLLIGITVISLWLIWRRSAEPGVDIRVISALQNQE